MATEEEMAVVEAVAATEGQKPTCDRSALTFTGIYRALYRYTNPAKTSSYQTIPPCMDLSCFVCTAYAISTRCAKLHPLNEGCRHEIHEDRR